MEPVRTEEISLEVRSGITNVTVNRTLTHKGVICKSGNIWYVYTFVKGGGKYEGAIQLTTAWDEANDAIAYIKKTYIYQREAPLPVAKVVRGKSQEPGAKSQEKKVIRQAQYGDQKSGACGVAG